MTEVKLMLTQEFISICRNYAQGKQHALSQDVEDTKKVCKFKIRFYSHAVEFRYVKKESIYFKPSSLYCLVYLNKNSVAYYHLTDLIPHLQTKPFQPCYFGCIENPDRLSSCFNSLVSTLEAVVSQLSFSSSEETALSSALFGSYKAIFNLKDSDLDFSKIDNPKEYAQSFFLSLQNTRDGYLFSRYNSFAPYALLLKNKVKKAVNKYEKLNQKGKLLDYEKSLLKQITEVENSPFEGAERNCDFLYNAEKQITGLNFLKALLIVYPIASLLFCACFAIYNAIISVNALAVLSAPWYAGFLCAAFCSIFGTIAVVALFPLPSRRISLQKQKELLKILVSKGLRRFAIICFALSVAASIFFTVMIMIPSIRFYDDHIAFYGNHYRYDDIDSIYYISARYNPYGDRIERGSYVILFEDHTSLDLDGSASVEVTIRDVLPILKAKGFEIQFADSERELPWYTEE